MQDWKKLEYEVARYFGGRRRRMQKYYVQGPDVDQPVADLEVKLRKRVPQWIVSYLKKCQDWSRRYRPKIAAVLIYGTGSSTDASRGYALLSTSDLKILLDAFQEALAARPRESPGPSLGTPPEPPLRTGLPETPTRSLTPTQGSPGAPGALGAPGAPEIPELPATPTRTFPKRGFRRFSRTTTRSSSTRRARRKSRWPSRRRRSRR